MRARLGQIVMSQVAQRAPEKALRLVDTQPSQQQQVMVQTVIMTMARTDPQKALRVVGTLQTQQEKLNAYSGLFSQWAQVDPAGAGAALEGLTGIPIDNKFSMASQIAQAMAASEPEASRNSSPSMRASPEPARYANSGRSTVVAAAALDSLR